MRRFIFTAKNIGRERYLTYIMGEGMEVDEDVLDYCEDNDIPEILNIIYEEDDDYDYLTYDITGRTTLEKFTEETVNREKVFTLLRNISLAMISVKEHAIPLSYILLNKGFMYVDPDTLSVKFLYLPVESEASVSAEFKSFVRQLMAGMKYDVEEDVSYVGQLLTYINGDSFNLRGLIGLTEAMMQDAGMAYSEESGIETEDGAEVVDTATTEADAEQGKGAMDFMSDLGNADDKLPEIGDDDEEDIELANADTTVLTSEDEAAPEEAVAEPEAEEEIAAEEEEAEEEEVEEEEVEEESAPEEEEEEHKVDEEEHKVDEEVEEVPVKETATPKNIERETEHTETLEDIKAKLQELAGAVDGKNPPPKPPKKEPGAKPVRVSRAAMLKAAEEAIEEEEAAAENAAEEETEADTKKKSSKKDAKKEEAEKKEPEKKEPEKKAEVIDNTILGAAGAIKINPYLIRVNTKERIMINKPVFKIGKATRGVDYRVSGNGAISRQHAVIVHKGDSYYIKDNKSTNHTYVNDVEIADDEEVLLKDNATIRLGDEDFTFRLG
ncbi:MAG: FHA domain-containing protein [Eubacterium sp.]|nr:FHA domain-containing protein [Eubacterium sp.]